MKTHVKTFAVACLAAIAFASCNKEVKEAEVQEEISEETLTKIYNLGFGKDDVKIHEDGYLVEGDIILTHEALNSTPTRQLLRFPTTEQYHTFNTVKDGSSITVSMSSRLPASYEAAVKAMVDRFNKAGINLTFSYVGMNKAATITFVKGGGNYLASAGFPSSSGVPYGEVKVNASYLGKNPALNYLTTIFAHEVGHCIGFRHSDWMDRSISCGGSPSNEGQQYSGVGAVHISGTPEVPTRADGSWMLACIGTGQDRPFNAADIASLRYLYP